MTKREQSNEDLPSYLEPPKILRPDGTVYTKPDGTEMTSDEAADFIRDSAMPAEGAPATQEPVQPSADQDSEQPMQPA